MTETILRLLTRLSEAGDDAILTGEMAKPFQGTTFDRLLARRLLIEQAPTREWEVCDRCDCGLSLRSIRATESGFRAECPFDQRQDVDLTEDDLRVYRIGAAALASAISVAAGLSAHPAQLVDGIWQLGNTQSGRAVFLVLKSATITGDGIAAMLRQAVQGQEITILAPDLPPAAAKRLRDAGLHLVETLSVMVAADDGFGASIRPSALSPAQAAEMLRIQVSAAEVNWAGRSVILSHQLFPVFNRLVDKAQSRDQVASVSHVEGTTGREAKDLIRELRAAFVAAGFTKAETEALIVTVRGRGYRLGILATGIVIEGRTAACC